MALSFKTATDRLMECVRIPTIAEALRLSANAVARYRVDPGKEAHRQPSGPWRGALAQLAREREAAFRKLAEELEASPE